MAYTQTQYEELQAAIAQGATTVKHGDRLVTYRSITEMVRILSMMAAELGTASQSGGRVFTSFGKGF